MESGRAASIVSGGVTISKQERIYVSELNRVVAGMPLMP